MRRKPLAAFLGVLAVSVGVVGVLLPVAQAQPTYVNSWSAGSSSTVLSFPVTVATTAGDTVVVTISRKATTCTVSSVTDNGASGGSTYNSLVGPVSNTVGFNIYGTPVNAAKAATTVTVTLSGTACKVAVAVGDYSGVTNYGNTNTATGSGANPGPVAVTVQDANGAVAGGFATNDGTAQTAFTGGGTLRQAPVSTGGSSSTRNGGSLVDQLNQAAGSRSIQTTHSAIAWAGGVVELRNQGTLISVSCTDAGHPLTANQSFYIQGIVNYIRLSCTVDGKAYTTGGSIVATPTFTLPAPFTELWSFDSGTPTGGTCSAGTNAWAMSSGVAHTFPSTTATWDYCAVIPNSATADWTSFTVAWNG